MRVNTRYINSTRGTSSQSWALEKNNNLGHTGATGAPRGHPDDYHLWKLPQVNFCCDNSSVTTNTCLSQQKHIFCHDKSMLAATKHVSSHTFVLTNICRDKHNFVAKSLLLSQQMCLLRQNTFFVATKVCLSQQNFCCDGQVLLLLRQKYFVATSKILSRQKFWRGKHTFVVTKDLFWSDKNDSCGSSRQW